jgi:WD40 repeat protein
LIVSLFVLIKYYVLKEIQVYGRSTLNVCGYHSHLYYLPDRIQVSSDHAFFASASNDGTVKLWESEKLEGNSVANRSKQTLKDTSVPGEI